jgi:pSer/pThr/pTyr-binding forkhead associated (FHA) protein
MAVDGPDAGGIKFPPFCPDRHFPLQGKQVSIGRQSRTRGISPDIDLLGPPEDPGVSHLHALLLAQPDGSWAIVDLDSANGTLVNDEPNPLSPNTPRPLADGDRVYVGAWTRITLRRT